jgi:hypothetical protein
MIWSGFPAAPKMAFFSKVAIPLVFVFAFLGACAISLATKYSEFRIAYHASSDFFTRTVPPCFVIALHRAKLCLTAMSGFIKNLPAFFAGFIRAVFGGVLRGWEARQTLIPSGFFWCGYTTFSTAINARLWGIELNLAGRAFTVYFGSHNSSSLRGNYSIECKDKDYYAAACKRFEQHKAQGSLFIPDTPRDTYKQTNFLEEQIHD